MKFVGQPLEIPAAVNDTQAVRKSYVDAVGTRVSALEASAGSGGSAASVVVFKSAAYTANAREYVLASASGGAFTVTLPSVPVANTVVSVKKVDTTVNAVTVVGSDSTTIDGDPSAIFGVPQSGGAFVFDGTNWRVTSTVIFDAPLGVTYRGTYAPTTAYAVNDLVTYQSSTYVALAAVTGTAPTVNASTATWGLIAASGQLYTTFQGVYSSSVTYALGQIVTFSGGTYMALASVTGSPPTAGSSTATWALIAAQGVQFRGLWSSATAYAVNDLAVFKGETFIVTVAHTAQTPTPHAASTYWTPFASGLAFRGTYNSGVTYYLGDVVYYNGSSFTVATNTPFSGFLPTNTSYWFQMSAAASFTNSYKGTWSSATAYVAGDLVQYSGSMYAASQSGSNQVPSAASSAYWNVVAYGFNYRSAWSGSTTYSLNDVVSYAGSSWVYVNTTPAQATPALSNSGYWLPFALGLRYLGAYSAGSGYYVNDVVIYNNNAWLCINGPISAITPSYANSTSWTPLGLGLYERGNWAPSTVYQPGDMVVSGGSNYLWALTTSATDGTTAPFQGNANWTRIASGFRVAGAWSSGTYYINDVVYYNNNSYVATATTATTPPGTGWTLFGAGGQTPATSVGTVSGLAPGATPTVTNTGTSPNVVLNFGIPAGAGYTFRSTWSSAIAYAINDVVTYLGSSYMAVAASTNSVPNTIQTTPWKVIAQGESPKGLWSSATGYYPGDTVNYQGSSYLYINAASAANQAPNVSGSAYWTLMSQGLYSRGAWTASTVYYPGDVVTNGNSTWLWTQTTSATDSTTNPYQGNTNWIRLTGGFFYRGAWSAGTYFTNDVVTFNGSTYVTTATTSVTPPGGNWLVFALAGTNGVSFTYRGAWVSGSTYAINDVLTYNGASYTTVAATSTTTAPTPTGTTPFQRITAGFNFLAAAYSSATTYQQNDVVTYNGNTYVAINSAAFSNQAPPAGAYWALMARGLNVQGAWSSLTAYLVNDVVTFSGSSYAALTANTNVSPTAGASNATWALIALKGADGTAGTNGTNGTNGTAATVAVGTTSTGAAGSSATVTNSGSSSAAVFNFTIPQGIAGTAGTNGTNGTNGVGFTYRGAWSSATAYLVNDVVSFSGSSYTALSNNTNTTPTAGASNATWALIALKGIDGSTGTAGTNGTNGTNGSAATVSAGTTTTGAAGTNASVSNSGTSSAAVFDFTIPRGNTGTAGSAATVAAGTTTTGAPGSSASVSNSGTSSAAVFDFTIPRGATGTTGNTGSTGPAGPGLTTGGTVGTAPSGAAAAAAGQLARKNSTTDYDTAWSWYSVPSFSTFAAMNTAISSPTVGMKAYTSDYGWEWTYTQITTGPTYGWIPPAGITVASAYQTSAQSIPNTTSTAFTFDATLINISSQTAAGATLYTPWASTSTATKSNIVTPFTGWYEVNGGATWAINSTGYRLISLQRTSGGTNFTVVGSGDTQASLQAGYVTTHSTRTTLTWCAAGDTIALIGQQNSGSALSTSVSATSYYSTIQLAYKGPFPLSA